MSSPTITRISPTSGPTTGGITVVIIGTNLASPSAVTFDGISATINSSSPTSISVTAPAHPAGVARVLVTTAAGTSTQPVNFTYVTISAPVITSLSPTNGPASGGNTVTIIGTNLLFTTGVTFGTTPASSFAILSNIQVTATAPASTAGATTVSVTNGTGTSNTLPYTYNGIAAPVVSTVSPTSGPASGGNTVVINGSGLTNATAVTFGSTAATSFTVVSDTQINAVAPAGPSAGGSVSISVTGPGGTSAGTTYTYTVALAPIVTGISPASGPVSGGNTAVINGFGFTNATAVTFGPTAAISFTAVSNTVINAVVPPGPSAGTNVSVLVTGPGGTSAAGITYNYVATPVISSVSPTSGPASGGNTVVINGSDFTNATAVTFGPTAATSFTVVSNTVINAVVPPGPSAGANVSVLITTPGGTSGAGTTYTYRVALTPIVTGISPASGPVLGGNTAVINGFGFTNATAVTFGPTAAISFTAVSNTVINAVVPPGPSAGTNVSVLVTGPGGTSAASITYIYVAAPVISSVSPTSGPASGGNTVVINGSDFTNATAVTFGSTAATSFTVISNTVINAVVPPGPTAGGSVSVHVRAPGGTSAAGTSYTYSVALTPIVTGLSPASGPVSGGNTVTLTGSNLNGATAVTFAGNAASSFAILSSTGINAVAPPGTAGTVSVVVTTPAGPSLGFNYTYIAPPAPTAVFPTSGVTAGGDSVAITGTGLTGTTSVNFGTTPATSFTVVSDTEVDAITPAHLVGTVPINITTLGGTDSSLSFTFQPSPVISSITPTSGPTTGGTVVTITGVDLIGTLDVNFGTTVATAVAVVSDSTVTATAPAKAAGASAVTVNTASATSNGATFIYVAEPTLTGLSPTDGPVVGGNNVTLTGTGFTTATNVFFGANPAAFTILNDVFISAVAPSGFGAVSVTVTNPGGTSGAKTYTYS
ncbi:hypothetical protein VE00_11175 [Pseudogymnoascus sp. WSF 3629]|nr:hypothetical protein VE00_11175 [Pseudogymnoascus sp. WSF 3629]